MTVDGAAPDSKPVHKGVGAVAPHYGNTEKKKKEKKQTKQKSSLITFE